MNDNQQIIDMALDIMNETSFTLELSGAIAMGLYDRGWRKSTDNADVVEVVRCKDCVSLNYATDGSFCYCKHRSGLKYFVEADDFCSYGERK